MIIQAFNNCSSNAKVVFDNTTYHIDSVMNITGLSNVEVDLQGTLLWSTDIDYWLNHSMPVGYQNQSTAFIFGGDNIYFHGNGYGTFDGNGQTWYDFIGNASNYPLRPHQITWNGLTNSVIEGVRFVQSQMWTMTLIHSENVLLQDIYVNSTNLKGGPDQNTDGADTIYANNITFVRWSVTNGDDSISQKANSTNILAEDCSFFNGGSMAMGSIGQYAGRYETIINVTARNVYCYHTSYAGYAKTWTGITQGYPPNGGGGGTGLMKNITFQSFTLVDVDEVFSITQCNSYAGFTGGCDTSTFQIENFTVDDITGTLKTNDVASLQCSGAAPCFRIDISDVHVTVNHTGVPATGYLCSNVTDPIGFTCTGLTKQT